MHIIKTHLVCLLRSNGADAPPRGIVDPGRAHSTFHCLGLGSQHREKGSQETAETSCSSTTTHAKETKKTPNGHRRHERRLDNARVSHWKKQISEHFEMGGGGGGGAVQAAGEPMTRPATSILCCCTFTTRPCVKSFLTSGHSPDANSGLSAAWTTVAESTPLPDVATSSRGE